MKPQQQLSLPFHQLTLSPRQLTLLQRYLTLQWRQLKNQVVGIQVYIYIFIDLYNVSERYTESPSAVCESVHVHYTSIKFHCETSLEQLLSMQPCNFPSLKYSQIRPSFLFKLVFISMYFIIHAFKKLIPLFDSLLSVLKNIKTNAILSGTVYF